MPVHLSVQKLRNKLLADNSGNRAALEATINVLETGGNLADLAPVPGLASILDVLARILKKVQATKANSEALKGLQEQVEHVYKAIRGVSETVYERVDVLESPDRIGVEAQLRTDRTSKLVTRINELGRCLNEVLSEAEQLADKSRLARFFQSDQITDAIGNMATKVDQACRNFQLQGGIAIEVVARETLGAVMNEADQRMLDRLSPLDGASYRSVDNAPKSRFLQGTREEIFRNLESWVEKTSQPGAEHRVLVLIGAAGMGKSTIASEFCRRLSDQNRLGASFFFTRGTQGLNSIRGFFNTIACQLASLQPDRMHDAIAAAARKHLAKGGASQNMKDACEDLIRAPLRAVSASSSDSPIFVVVDALDECTAEEVDTIPEFLSLLLSCTQDASSSLRIFLTSRPETQRVRSILDSHTFVSVRHLLDIGGRKVVNRDISAVITHRLSQHPTTRTWSDADPTIVEKLVSRSEGIFVYASTAAEFLIGHAEFGTATLNRTLSRLLSDGGSPGFLLQRLDMLYLTVLETAFPAQTMSPDLREQIPLVLGLAAVWRNPWISPQRLEALTGIPCDDTRSILHQLRAVVERDANDAVHEFRIMHTTFRDFLLDTEKMKALPRSEFHVNATQAHAMLTLQCMRLGVYYVERYMPELLEESSETLELGTLDYDEGRRRLSEKLRGKKVDEPQHSVHALWYYVDSHCAYHRQFSTAVQSAEMIEVAARFDRIPSGVLTVFIRAIFDAYRGDL